MLKSKIEDAELKDEASLIRRDGGGSEDGHLEDKDEDAKSADRHLGFKGDDAKSVDGESCVTNDDARFEYGNLELKDKVSEPEELQVQPHTTGSGEQGPKVQDEELQVENGHPGSKDGDLRFIYKTAELESEESLDFDIAYSPKYDASDASETSNTSEDELDGGDREVVSCGAYGISLD